jgi:hypothetical protein
MMPDRRSQSPELLMPVSDEGAALQFFVEAMKANTAVLKGLQEEQKGVISALHNIDIRLTRIESNSVNADVATLKADVRTLMGEKLRREGAVGLASGTLKNGPVIVSFLTVLIVVLILLVANGKIG